MYKIMTFQANGHPTSIENQLWSTRFEAEKRMDKLSKIYHVPMFIRKVEKKKSLFF